MVCDGQESHLSRAELQFFLASDRLLKRHEPRPAISSIHRDKHQRILRFTVHGFHVFES
jgi:hypothetical protein